jgi:hypothetical protein
VARRLVTCHHAASDEGDCSFAEAQVRLIAAASHPNRSVSDEVATRELEQDVPWVQEQTRKQMA